MLYLSILKKLVNLNVSQFYLVSKNYISFKGASIEHYKNFLHRQKVYPINWKVSKRRCYL